MKNEKIIASWNKILPDEAADERMRSKIMDYRRSQTGKDKIISMPRTMRKLFPIAACFVLAVAVTAFIGVQKNRFGAKSYIVTLDNGEKLVYENDSSKTKVAACYSYACKLNDRTLTADELHTLFPAINDITENSLPYAAFKEDTGELFLLDTTFDDIHVHLVKSGSKDLIVFAVGAEENTADINGIAVKTGYFVTDANSKGIKTAVFYAEYDMNNTSFSAEIAGNEQDSKQLSEKLSDFIYNMIIGNAPDISTIKYQ